MSGSPIASCQFWEACFSWCEGNTHTTSVDFAESWHLDLLEVELCVQCVLEDFAQRQKVKVGCVE